MPRASAGGIVAWSSTNTHACGGTPSLSAEKSSGAGSGLRAAQLLRDDDGVEQLAEPERLVGSLLWPGR
jgi:hypothetical protein